MLYWYIHILFPGANRPRTVIDAPSKCIIYIVKFIDTFGQRNKDINAQMERVIFGRNIFPVCHDTPENSTTSPSPEASTPRHHGGHIDATPKTSPTSPTYHDTEGRKGAFIILRGVSLSDGLWWIITVGPCVTAQEVYTPCVYVCIHVCVRVIITCVYAQSRALLQAE